MVMMGLQRRDAFVVVCSSHWVLMAAVGAIMAMDTLLIELLKSLADYERLNALQCVFCFVYAAYPCGFSVDVKCIADAYVATKESNNCEFNGFRRAPSWGWQDVWLLGLGIPFCVFVVASFSYYLNPDFAGTFR